MRLNRREAFAEARRLLWLAWPVVLTSLNWTLLHLIDVAVVGHVSTHELGALAAGRSLTFITIVIGIAALSGVLVFVSRADGARDHAEVGRVLRRGMVLAMAMGIFWFVVLLVWADQLVSAIGVPDDLASGGARVVRAMAYGFLPQYLLTAAAYALEGVSKPRRPMIVNLVMLPMNAALAWAWAAGHLGFPPEGAAGAAKATALTSFIGAVAMYAMVWTLPNASALGVRDLSARAWKEALRSTGQLVRFGFVPAVAAGLELLGFSWLIALSTQLGAVTASAFQIVFSLHNFAFAFALGLASAAGIRVGNAVGAMEPEMAWPRSLIATAIAIVAMMLVSAVYVVGSAAILMPFTNDAEVRVLARAMLVIWAPFILFDGIQMVFVYALRSLGDQVMAGINGIIAFFAVTGGLGWLLVKMTQLGPMSLVYASIAGMVVAAILQAGRMMIVTARLRRSRSSAASGLPVAEHQR